MCKLGDKDYWQVGDNVYSLANQQKGCIRNIVARKTYPVEVIYDDRELLLDTFTMNGASNIKRDKQQVVFHLGAITLDEQGRPIAINYDYVPERTPRVQVTKLPHEFVEGEEVLGRDAITGNWLYHKFVKLSITDNFHPFKVCRVDKFFKHEIPTVIKYCIPYKGNEHCEGKSTNCESGKIPYDYVFPKPDHVFKPFDRVLVKHELQNAWSIDLFEAYDANSAYKFLGLIGNYKYCIPFEGNERLLGKTDNPEE